MKQYVKAIEYIVVVTVVIMGITFLLDMKNQEVNFAKKVFSGLIKGRFYVGQYIDWDNLQMLDVNAGETYRGLANNEEKINYRKTFISNFSRGFRENGGKYRAFTNWRIYAINNDTVTIAAYYPLHRKTILFTFSKSGGKKLTSIQWQ